MIGGSTSRKKELMLRHMEIERESIRKKFAILQKMKDFGNAYRLKKYEPILSSIQKIQPKVINNNVKYEFAKIEKKPSPKKFYDVLEDEEFYSDDEFFDADEGMGDRKEEKVAEEKEESEKEEENVEKSPEKQMKAISYTASPNLMEVSNHQILDQSNENIFTESILSSFSTPKNNKVMNFNNQETPWSANKSKRTNSNKSILNIAEFLTSPPAHSNTIISRYLRSPNLKNEDLDNGYGLRKEGDYYKMGSKRVSFSANNDEIDIEGTIFPINDGLAQLLLFKDVNENNVQDGDLEVYKKILEASNAHRKNYAKNGPLRGTRAKKYTKYIGPLFKKQGGGLEGSSLYTQEPNYKLQRICANQLVERLRVLEGARRVGHDNWSNEFESIVGELRRRKIIF